MKRPLKFLSVLLLASLAPLKAAEIKLTSPLEHQVVQRNSREKGVVRIAGEIRDAALNGAVAEVRIVEAGSPRMKCVP